MGIVAAVLLLLAAGTLVNALIVRRVLARWERFLDRIPVVKTIYGATRDFMKLLPAGGKRRDLKRVVLARFGEAQVIGFVTRDDASELGIVGAKDDLLAVYFPMSYQIGGYTALLPRSSVVPLDLSVETAMRMVLTADPAAGRNGCSRRARQGDPLLVLVDLRELRALEGQVVHQALVRKDEADDRLLRRLGVDLAAGAERRERNAAVHARLPAVALLELVEFLLRS